MKRQIISRLSVIGIILTAALALSAQTVRPPVPRASQKATIMQTLGTTEVSITYSRPAVKGRTIFGEAPDSMNERAKGEATLDNQNERKPGEPIVPYGHLWRAGANEATLFVATDDVLINGQPLAAGRYSFHAIPGKSEWTLVFNKDEGQWGSFFYDDKKDALRIKAKPETAASNTELLTFEFDPVGETSATVNLRWANVRVPFAVEVKDPVGATMARLRAYVAGAKPDEWQRPLNAANYANANKLTAEANKWYDDALKALELQIAAKPNFANYRQKAIILHHTGRGPEALVAAEKALEVGRADSTVKPEDIAAFEKRVVEIKAGKD